MEEMIIAKNIRKSFGSLEVLKGIDMVVNRGEVVAIMGASGAGKSTLLQILGTLSTPGSGELVIDGITVFSNPAVSDKPVGEISSKSAGSSSGKCNTKTMDSRQLARFRNLEIGFVFQFHHLLPEFTALENVMIPSLIAGDSKKVAKEKAVALIEEVGLFERAGHKPSELSGGEQQRVAIARAIVNGPAVLFADEPSGNLDSVTKSEIHDLFFRLREKTGQTTVIVTHDASLAQMCDRTLFMRDGLFVSDDIFAANDSTASSND